VYKSDGCDSMTCGRDAADKGGGNRQVRIDGGMFCLHDLL
jgi:hypothetical protein